MKGRELLEIVVTRRHGTRHTLVIEIDHDRNSINVPASGELYGQSAITAFMADIQRAAALLALGQDKEER